MDKDLDEGRRIARRNWAYISFSFIMSMGLLTFGTLLFSDSRKLIADALMAAWPLLSAFLTVDVTIILAYLGVSHMDKRLNNREDEPS